MRSRHVDLSKRKASVSKNVPSVESQDETVLATKNLRSRNVDLSKRKQDKASLSKNVPSVESQDKHVPEEDVSIVSVPRRNSDRRNSFISSLMSRSKVAPYPIPPLKFSCQTRVNHLQFCSCLKIVVKKLCPISMMIGIILKFLIMLMIYINIIGLWRDRIIY